MRNINKYSQDEIKMMPIYKAEALTDEIRDFLVENVTLTGGHLASNLGIVEISLGLIRTFSAPEDKIIYDTGHQSYVHKLLTGRIDDFCTLRQYGGMSGFTKRTESDYDPFGAGHSSTSISAAIGFARAAALKGENHKAIAVIGDGAFTGGMVYEALNNIKSTDNIIIILNDNEMSISKNVGAISRYLNKIRTTDKYFNLKEKSASVLSSIPLVGDAVADLVRNFKNDVKSVVLRNNFFEQLGINYLGPADGNDLKTVERILKEASKRKEPIIIHFYTKKGKGYSPAESDPANFHSVSPAVTCEECKPSTCFSDVFGKRLTKLAKNDNNIVAVTAAMADGVGLTHMKKHFPKRFFDVGIAEQHAMTFAAGLAAGGMLPFFAVYSTFFQRSYDQLLHDIVLQNLKAVIVLDRAGLVGEDGPTHHGLFDVSLSLNMPGVDIYSPATYSDLISALDEVTVKQGDEYANLSPAIIRYPKGEQSALIKENFACKEEIETSDSNENADAIIITYGRITANALEAAQLLRLENIHVQVVKITKLKPLNKELLNDKTKSNPKLVYFLEEGMRCGGFSEYFISGIAIGNIELKANKYLIRAIDEEFIPHGNQEELFRHSNMAPDQIAKEIKEALNET